MSAPNVLLPLDVFAADYAAEGARTMPHANVLVMRSGRDVDTTIVPQPPSNDWSDIKLALGAKAVRQPFERRRAGAHIDVSRRDGPDVKAEKHLALDLGCWREIALAHDDLSRIESNIADARVAHRAVTPGDAPTTILDGERRAYLRALSLSDRMSALRSDPDMLQAAMRAPTLAGIATDAERDGMAEAWETFCDARDPAQAARIAEFSERVAWSRTAINRAAKVLAAETTTDASAILASLDAVDSAKLGSLVTTVPAASITADSPKLVKTRRFALLGAA